MRSVPRLENDCQGAEVRSWLYETSSMHRERERWWMDTSDSMDSIETQSERYVASARKEIALLRLFGRESDNVISETNGRVSTTELT